MLVCHLYIFFREMSVQVFCYFLIGLIFFFFCYWVIGVLYMVWLLIPYKCFANIFSHSVGCLSLCSLCSFFFSLAQFIVSSLCSVMHKRNFKFDESETILTAANTMIHALVCTTHIHISKWLILQRKGLAKINLPWAIFKTFQWLPFWGARR